MTVEELDSVESTSLLTVTSVAGEPSVMVCDVRTSDDTVGVVVVLVDKVSGSLTDIVSVK